MGDRNVFNALANLSNYNFNDTQYVNQIIEIIIAEIEDKLQRKI